MTYDGTPKHVWLEGLPEGVVPTYSGNEATDRQSHTLTKEGRTDIAEVTAGHTSYYVISKAQFLELSISIEVIEALGQEASHINAIG